MEPREIPEVDTVESLHREALAGVDKFNAILALADQLGPNPYTISTLYSFTDYRGRRHYY